ncbi:MAG: DPP IV N-terminal domain-containing protein, partial [Tangfeifania sp.]
MKNLQILFLLLIPCTLFAQIQKNNQSRLTIEQIMQEPDEWVGSLPERIYWGEQGENIYFDWNPEQDTLSSLYRFSLKNEEIEKVSPEEKKKLPERQGTYNKDKTKKVYSRDGNLFLYTLKNDTEKQLTNWLERASSPRFALNGSHISFMMKNNLFLLNLENGEIKQVTNF